MDSKEGVIQVNRDTAKDRGIEEKITDSRVRMDSKEGVIQVNRDTSTDRGIEEKITDSRVGMDSKEGVIQVNRDTATDRGIEEKITDSRVRMDSKEGVIQVNRDTATDRGIEEKITDNRVRMDSKEGVIQVIRDTATDRGIEEKIIRFRNPVDEEGIVSQVKQTKTDSLKLEELSSENVEGESKKVNKVDKDFKGEADYDSILMRLQTQTIVNKHPEKEQVSNFFEKLDNLISERIVKGDDKGEAILNLHPDIIGEVRIRVFLDGDRLSIRLLVSNEEARSFISDGLDTLRENLSQKGFNLGNVNVYIMGQDMGTSYGRNNHGSFIFSPFIEKEKDTIDIVDIVNTSSKIDLIV
jgi:hypothetical protein